jgi:hypothetical protein
MRQENRSNKDSGGALIPQLRRLIQQEYKWDAIDALPSALYSPNCVAEYIRMRSKRHEDPNWPNTLQRRKDS